MNFFFSNDTKVGPERKNSRAVKIHPLSTSGIETSILWGAAHVRSRSLRCLPESLHSSLSLHKKLENGISEVVKLPATLARLTRQARENLD